ncbi:MAG: HAMP domain-containing protein, partial [Chthoniobacterales bacterium]
MRSKPTEPRSISSQLVLRFTIAAALLLCCGLAILYGIVVAHADEEDNEALADKLFAVRADLQSEDGPQFLQKELSAPRPRERVTYWVRVLDPAGRMLAETAGMNALLPVGLFPKPAQTGARLDPIEVRSHDRLFGLMAVNDIDAARPYQIQLAQDRSVDEQFTRHFGLLVIAVLAIGCLVAALIARTVTRRGLRPLREIVQSLERTGPTRLHERVEPESWPRELQPLVIAFDEMLDRLEDSFTRLSQFSADLAHELRTPVAILRGEAEVALRRPRT